MLAIIAAGVWAYFQFSITDTMASNVQIGIVAESLPYAEETRLLVVHIKPRNIGKVPVTPSKDGFIVTIRAIPANAKAGAIELVKLPDLYKTDLLKRFRDGYLLEPGVEYDEVVALVVPASSMYAVEAVLNLGDKDEVDITAVARVE